MVRSVILALMAGWVLLFGCRTLDPEPGIALPLTIPERFSIEHGSNKGNDFWWKSFDSPELDAFIQAALNQNFDLQTLKSKIGQERAKLAKEQASFFPDLGFSLGGQKKGVKTGSADAGFAGSHSWDGALSTSYTVDVWKEAAAGEQSQALVLKAAQHDLQNAVLELTARIAEIWVDIISVRNKQRILDSQIRINQTLLELQKLRFVNGKARALDVSQQREALAEARSQVPVLEKQEQLLLNSLAFLSGTTRTGQVKVTTQELPQPILLPNVGIPSDLLENRPDIQAARMLLSSSQFDVTAARADLLPSFRLTAQALFSSGNLDLFFHNWVATLAGTMAGPVFDGGLRKAEVERTQAVAQAQLQLYAKTVAEAIREVEDSLISIQKQEEYIRLLEEELAVARLTLEDARIQYQNGQSSYLSYLIAWTGIERLERQLVGERAVYIKEGISLYRALGWKMAPASE